MADHSAKHNGVPAHGSTALISDLKSLLSVQRTRRTVAFIYGFMIASIVVTVFLAFNPSASSGAPWLTNVFSSSTTTTSSSSSSSDSYRSQFSSIFSYFFPTNTSSPSSSSPPLQTYTVASPPSPSPPPPAPVMAVILETNSSRSGKATFAPPPTDNRTRTVSNSDKSELSAKNHNNASSIPGRNQPQPATKNLTAPSSNQTVIIAPVPPSVANNTVGSAEQKSASQKPASNNKESLSGKQSNGTNSGASAEQGKKYNNKDGDLIESLKKCDLFDGEWVRDDSYQLYYQPGSCSLIDEQFNCILNGRPDKDYQKFKWKPKACSLPRLDGKNMLEMLKGKRLVFVGDSINRNMWESLICILKNAAKDPSKVFEAQGRHHFRGEASYSFIVEDYNCTVEFFVSPFLVQEWEVKDKNGNNKETLRLDLMGKSSEQYKGADIIVFNTGHWWTHEKTSKGEDYYQEGSHVYKQLDVVEAFRRAVTTWARWVDANVNPMKSAVFFRGYSHSHFSGGQWNSGGACDSETVPIKNETYLRPYLPKMTVLEKVLKGMKTDVTYLNVTKMTDFRKDGHPSIYRKQNLSPEERRSPLRFQDCSHWCLPGVPDTWNEMLYAALLVRFGQKQQQQQQKRT